MDALLPASRSLSPLCSFLCFLQLFFSRSSGPQLCFSGPLRSLLVRYRCSPGRGGTGPVAAALGDPARSCSLAPQPCLTWPQLSAVWRRVAGRKGLGSLGRGCCRHLRTRQAWSHPCHHPPPVDTPILMATSPAPATVIPPCSSRALPLVTENRWPRGGAVGLGCREEGVLVSPDLMAFSCQSQSPFPAAVCVSPSAMVIDTCLSGFCVWAKLVPLGCWLDLGSGIGGPLE